MQFDVYNSVIETSVGDVSNVSEHFRLLCYASHMWPVLHCLSVCLSVCLCVCVCVSVSASVDCYQCETTREVDVESYMAHETTWQTSFYEQYKTLVRRNLLRDRERHLSRLHVSQLLFVAVFAGLVWFRTERTERTAEDRIGIV